MQAEGPRHHHTQTVRIRRRWVVAWLVALIPSLPAVGHEGLHAQIKRATEQIARDADNADLYLRRGELHRLHRDWDAALADFEMVARLEPAHDTLDYSRGRLFRQAGWPRASLMIIDRFLAAHPDHGPGRLERARTLADLGRPTDAADAYDGAIAALAKRTPDIYIERARVFPAGNAEHDARILAGLEQGLADLGAIVVLELEAVAIELRLERHDAALRRLDRLQSRSRRAETWLARKARVLEMAGRAPEAAEHYRRAVAAIEALPPRHRNVDAMKTLEQEITTGLARLGAAPPG